MPHLQLHVYLFITNEFKYTFTHVTYYMIQYQQHLFTLKEILLLMIIQNEKVVCAI